MGSLGAIRQRVAPRRNCERRATTGSRLNHMGNPKRSRWEIHSAWERTVRNTVWVLGYLLHQLVQDFFHQQYYRSNIISYTPKRKPGRNPWFSVAMWKPCHIKVVSVHVGPILTSIQMQRSKCLHPGNMILLMVQLNPWLNHRLDVY